MASRSFLPLIVGSSDLAPSFPFSRRFVPFWNIETKTRNPSVDYFAVAHGVVNRLFRGWSRREHLRAAEFNRHLLHHWEPQVAYSRLEDLERFLLQTSVSEKLRARQTTYRPVF